MSQTNERRQFHRIIMHRPVALSYTGGTSQAELLDISLKGALMALADDWRPALGTGAQARVQLGDDEDSIIEMQIRIARVSDDHIGVEAIRLDLDSACRLRRLVELNLADPALLERELSHLVLPNQH